jgi:pimeloyl-ACP methyl ester carboxylesterase
MPIARINGARISYRLKGRGPPMLLIHGLGGDSTSWEYVEPYLTRKFTLILPDMRCHGKSDCPEGLVPREVFANDMAELARHLGHTRVPMAGTSMGGMVLLQTMLDHPDVCSAAVLISTTPKVNEHLADTVYAWREAQINNGDEAYWWASTKDGLTSGFIESNPEILAHLKNKFLKGQSQNNVTAVLGFADFDVTPRLREIKLPVLVVHGAEDRIVLPEMADIMHRGIKKSKLQMLEGCGHSPDIEMPELLASLITEFLKG